MSEASVITNEDGGIKLGYSNNICRPKFAIMNPCRTFTLPPYQTAAGVTDIMMHTMERYFNPDCDMTITDELFNEGLARELVNRVQTLRKNTGLEVTDRIEIFVGKNEQIENAIAKFGDYICGETLASAITVVDQLSGEDVLEDELTENVKVSLKIRKKE